MLISESYRALNRELHERGIGYGTSGHKWASQVSMMAGALGAKDILDYGCGQQTLAQALPQHLVFGYDPAIPGLDSPPHPADFVTCTDVLEHIELDCLDDVLDDLKRLARKGVFLNVATRPAKKILSDGRNAHLIQEKAPWWVPKLMSRWDMRHFQATPGEFCFFGVSDSMAQPERMAA